MLCLRRITFYGASVGFCVITQGRVGLAPSEGGGSNGDSGSGLQAVNQTNAD
jgi:hypothetical protein